MLPSYFSPCAVCGRAPRISLASAHPCQPRPTPPRLLLPHSDNPILPVLCVTPPPLRAPLIQRTPGAPTRRTGKLTARHGGFVTAIVDRDVHLPGWDVSLSRQFSLANTRWRGDVARATLGRSFCLFICRTLGYVFGDGQYFPAFARAKGGCESPTCLRAKGRQAKHFVVGKLPYARSVF